MVASILGSLLSVSAAALLFVVTTILLYQLVRASWGIRVPAPVQGSERVSFGVLVPAHNEVSVIDALIDSLRRVRYPQERLHVLFVADHCDDGTVDKIRVAGFECLDRQSGPRGKPASLADGLDWLASRFDGRLDAIAFFDADNIVEPEFFRQAAAAIDAGHPVVQGNVGVQNWNATVFSRLNYMNAVVENRLEELARSQAGLSCNLRGHGMVMRTDVLQCVPWKSDSMVEDQDMLIRLVLNGFRVFWAEHARVNSVLPETTKDAATQRRRWAGGRSTIMGHAVKVLFEKWRSNGDRVAFHLMVDFLLPSHAVQLCLAFLALPLAALAFGIYSWQSGFALALIFLYFLYFAIGNWLSRVPIRTFLTVVVAPGYILWRTWIYISSLRGTKKWR